MFRGWKNVVGKLAKGPRDFQRGGGVGDGRQRKGTEGYGYLPQNPPKTPALSERKPKAQSRGPFTNFSTTFFHPRNIANPPQLCYAIGIY